MGKQQLIGLLGGAGSGKSTAGKILIQQHGYYEICFADPIKVYCHWMFGWDAKRLFDSSELRNEPDAAFPFSRCPSCGFTAYNMDAIDPKANEIVCSLCGAARAPYEWRADLSSRFALQSLGDWARNFYKQAYVEFALLRTVKVQNCAIECDPLFYPLKAMNVVQTRYLGHASLTSDNVLITDVRLKNEIEGIKAEGGKVYRIRREARPDTTTTGIPQHNSEMEQREVADEELDGVINNDETMDALRESLKNLITQP